MSLGQRRKSVAYITLGETDRPIAKIGESACAEGAKLRFPKAKSPSRLGGLEERRKFPQTPYSRMSGKSAYL